MSDDAEVARLQQEIEAARLRQEAEVARLQQEIEAAQAAQLAEIEARIAAQLAQARQDVQAEQQRRAAELSAAQQAAADFRSRVVEEPSHLTSWQQEELARQGRLAREAAEAAHRQALEPEGDAPNSGSTFGSPTSG
jgi:hypothetical protein